MEVFCPTGSWMLIKSAHGFETMVHGTEILRQETPVLNGPKIQDCMRDILRVYGWDVLPEMTQ